MAEVMFIEVINSQGTDMYMQGFWVADPPLVRIRVKAWLTLSDY